jgi:hypothetical protein
LLKYHCMRSRWTTVKRSITAMPGRNACEPPHQVATWRRARSHSGGFALDTVRVRRPRVYRCVNRYRLRRLTSCPIFDLTCIHTYLPTPSLTDIAPALI